MNIYALELSRLPNASLKIMQRLAKTLRRELPAQTNVVIETAATRLDQLTERIDAVLMARFVESNPELVASEVSFDRSVDGLWVMLRELLEARRAYAHPGLDALPPELAEAVDLEARRKEARTAERVWNRLFAAAGTTFTQARFIVQVESMATLLRVLGQDDLRAELVGVVGQGPIKLIEGCQTHYEAMVDDRLHRQSGASENLNDLRSELRWGLVAYVQAVQSLFDPAKPETAEIVLDALRPILVLREELGRVSSEDELVLDDFVELELPDAVVDAAAEPSEAAPAEA